MLTLRQLVRLRRACGQGIDAEPDVAAALERRANRVWRAALDLPPEPDAPANDSRPLALPRARWSFDRLARALGLRLVEESLPGLIVGAFVRAQEIVLVEESLAPEERTPVVSHECSHAGLHERASHEEVSYLALALIFPTMLVDEHPEGRAITAFSLRQLVPYGAPQWAAEYRAPILEALRRSGEW